MNNVSGKDFKKTFWGGGEGDYNKNEIIKNK
jgi:hypothetical protein